MKTQDKPIEMIIPKLVGLFEKTEENSHQKPMNLARKKFIILFIDAIIRCRSVQFTEVASHMNTEVCDASNLRRIQDFFANYRLNYRHLAMVLLMFLPDDKEAHLSIDRSNWTYGDLDINILAVTVYCKGVGIPLWFEMLEDKSGGNSNTAERKYVIRQVLKILQHRWLGGRQKRRMDNVKVWGHYLSIELKRLETKAKEIKHQYLFILTNAVAKGACEAYKGRWSIEVFFQSVKGRGFRIEQTHLQDLERLRKLFALASLAFALCLSMGIWWNECQQAIEVKNHGYKQNSFFRHGLNKIRECLRLRRHQILKKFIQFIDQLIGRIETIVKPKEKILM